MFLCIFLTVRRLELVTIGRISINPTSAHLSGKSEMSANPSRTRGCGQAWAKRGERTWILLVFSLSCSLMSNCRNSNAKVSNWRRYFFGKQLYYCKVKWDVPRSGAPSNAPGTPESAVNKSRSHALRQVTPTRAL